MIFFAAWLLRGNAMLRNRLVYVVNIMRLFVRCHLLNRFRFDHYCVTFVSKFLHTSNFFIAWFSLIMSVSMFNGLFLFIVVITLEKSLFYFFFVSTLNRLWNVNMNIFISKLLKSLFVDTFKKLMGATTPRFTEPCGSWWFHLSITFWIVKYLIL